MSRPTDGVSGRVFINRDQYFEGVDSGDLGVHYRLATVQRRNGLRTERAKSYPMRIATTTARLVAALADTERLMDEIDEIIEQHSRMARSVPIAAERKG